MSEENVEIVRRGYELFAAGDFEGLSALISPDAETPDASGLGLTGTATGVRHGPEGFLRGIEEVTEAFDDYRVEAEEFTDAGDAVVVSVRISGRGKTSGVEQEMRLVHMWVLRDGKAIRGEVYRTTEEALEAAGLSE
jgi:ketosteroid isomerase-like protein